MADAPLTLTFGERHPSSIKFDKVTATALATITVFAMSVGPMYASMGADMGISLVLPFFIWPIYFAYRITRRYNTTVTLKGDHLTVERASIIGFLMPWSTTYRLGTDTTVGIEPTAGWWIPTEILLMDGDNPQYFTDVALSTTDEHGVTHHVLISRDRAPKDVMMARREAVVQMLQGKQPPRD